MTLRIMSLLTLLAGLSTLVLESKVGMALFDAGLKKIASSLSTLNGTEIANIILQAVRQHDGDEAHHGNGNGNGIFDSYSSSSSSNNNNNNNSARSSFF